MGVLFGKVSKNHMHNVRLAWFSLGVKDLLPNPVDLLKVDIDGSQEIDRSSYGKQRVIPKKKQQNKTVKNCRKWNV